MRKILASAALLGALLFSAPAFALNCDAVISDEANFLGGNTAQVDAAANELIKLGATVRIRTFDDYSSQGGTLEEVRQGFEKQCSSWRDSTGGTRNNIVTIMVGLKPERSAAIFYGDLWVPAFRGSADVRIRTEVMNPRLRDEDYSAAFSLALKDISRLVTAQLNPPPANGNGSTTVINQAPQDNSGFVAALFWIIGLTALGLIGFFGFRGFAGWRRADAERRVAQLNAQTAKTSCANAINSFDLVVLTAKVAKVASIVSDDDASRFRQMLADVESQQNSSASGFSDLGQIAKMDPDTTGLSADEYATIAERYGAVLSGITAVRNMRSQLESELAAVEKSAANAPQAVATIKTVLVDAGKVIAKQAEAGFKTGAAETLLQEAAGLLTQAEGFLADKRSGAAFVAATRAGEAADQAIEVASALPKRKAATIALVSSLSARIEVAKKKANIAKDVFNQVEATYAPASWEDIAGNGTEGQKRIAAAEKALEDAGESAGMSIQDWDRADELVAKANAKLDECDQLFGAIVSRAKGLDDAKNKAQPEIDAASADIAKAGAFIKANKSDLSPLISIQLDEAKKLLKSAQAELGEKLPNYLFVVKQALAANHAADEILDNAQSEHEAMERKRRMDVSLMQEADRSIEAAGNYIRTHSADVGDGAVRRLKDAKAFFAQAQDEDDLDKRIALAKQADESADASLAKAKDDVEEEERRIRRRREEREESARNTGIVIGASSSSRRDDNWGSPPASSPGHSNGGSSGLGFGDSHGSSGGLGSGTSHGSSGGW